jgi:polysaccharide biosynthesis protein PslH
MSPRVCLISLDDPWATDHAGTQRSRFLTEALVEIGHEVGVVYVGASGASALTPPQVDARRIEVPPVGERHWVRPLRRAKRALLPMPTFRGALIHRLGRKVTSLRPQVVVVTQLRAAQYLENAPGAALWLDQSDLWSQFIREEVNRRRGISRRTAAAQLRMIRRVESKWVGVASALSCAGYEDTQILGQRVSSPVTWLPPPARPRSIPRITDGAKTAGFLANFAYWPNMDAFAVVRDRWAPQLKALGWRVVVAGLGSERLDRSDVVDIIGPVADVDDYYRQIDWSLAPLRLGGGVKVKIIESLMFRRPVVATPYALRGFPADLAEAVVATEPDRPDFSALEHQPSEEMFARAQEYFSIGTWTEKVDELVTRAMRAR